MKKAFLVEFTVRTRVVVDVPEDYNPGTMGETDTNVCAVARQQIVDDATLYLYGENAYIEEDEECPYDDTLDCYEVGDQVKVISCPSITKTMHGTNIGKIVNVERTAYGNELFRVEFSKGDTALYGARDLTKSNQ